MSIEEKAIIAEIAALKRENAVLKRTLEILITPCGAYIFPQFIEYAIIKSKEQAEKEIPE